MLTWITLGALVLIMATMVIGMSLSLRRAELRRFDADVRNYRGRHRQRTSHGSR